MPDKVTRQDWIVDQICNKYLFYISTFITFILLLCAIAHTFPRLWSSEHSSEELDKFFYSENNQCDHHHRQILLQRPSQDIEKLGRAFQLFLSTY